MKKKYKKLEKSLIVVYIMILGFFSGFLGLMGVILFLTGVMGYNIFFSLFAGSCVSSFFFITIIDNQMLAWNILSDNR